MIIFYLQIFAENKDKSLEEYILMCSKMYHGMYYQQDQKLAFEIAEKRDILFPQSWKKNKMAGRDWMYGFIQHHQNISC